MTRTLPLQSRSLEPEQACVACPFAIPVSCALTPIRLMRCTSIKAYTDALAIVPDSKEIQELLANAKQVKELTEKGEQLLKDGRFDEAADTLHAAVVLDPEYLKIADEEDEAQRKAKAQEYREQAKRQCDPTNWKKNYPNAVKTFDKALALDPHNEVIKQERDDAFAKCNADKLRKQAEAECDASDYAKAVDTFDAALKLDPDNDEIKDERADAARKAKAAALKAKGEQEMDDGDYAKAADTLSDALHLDPYNPELAAKEIQAAKLAKAAELKKEAQIVSVASAPLRQLVPAGTNWLRCSRCR